jgi:hypothetical protein
MWITAVLLFYLLVSYLNAYSESGFIFAKLTEVISRSGIQHGFCKHAVAEHGGGQ